jgi:hypothetical protein
MEKISQELQQGDSATMDQSLREKLLSGIPNETPKPASTTSMSDLLKRRKRMKLWAGVGTAVIAWFIIAPYVNPLFEGKNESTAMSKSAESMPAGAKQPVSEGVEGENRPLGDAMKSMRSTNLRQKSTPEMQSNMMSSPAVGSSIPTDRLVHRTADMNVLVQNTERVTEDIETKVKTLAGGYIASNDLTTNEDGTKMATLKVKVPEHDFELFLNYVAKQGTVQSKSLSGEDITEKTVDTKQETRSLNEQIWEAHQRLKNARTRSQGREATAEIRDLRIQIAQAEGRLELLRKLARLSDISLVITEKATNAPKTGGFLSQIKDTAQLAQEHFLMAVRIPIVLLVWIAVYSPLWLFVLLIMRLISRRQTGSLK